MKKYYSIFLIVLTTIAIVVNTFFENKLVGNLCLAMICIISLVFAYYNEKNKK